MTEESSAASTGTRDQENTSQITQKSFTAAQYRLSTLEETNILFHFSKVPKEICDRIAVITQRSASTERKKQLSRIAHTLHDKFISFLNGALRKFDCVQLFHEALFDLGYNDRLFLSRKAGTLF